MTSKIPPFISGPSIPTDSVLALTGIEVSLASRAGQVDILRGINLNVPKASALGIVGPSGSGKTTLLMAIAGLEPVSNGEIIVAGQNLAGMNEDSLARFRRDNIGIIFQSFHLIPTMTALENVAIPLEFKGHQDAFEIAQHELGHVGLGHRLEHYPGQLSGGEQQRVAIARALAAKAKIILADEPTGNLDQETGQTIIELLFALRRDRATTLILVTHDNTLAKRCDLIINIRDGLIAAPESPPHA